MTNQQIQALIDEAVATLKLTTVGYANHSPAWRANQTTAWWRGLEKLRQARAALDKIVVPPPPPPPPPSNRLVLNGTLTQMFMQAAAAKTACVVPTGTYTYNSWLTVPPVDILFDRVTLLPSNPGSSSLRITGSGTKATFAGACRIGAVGARNTRFNNGTACAFEMHKSADTTFHADDLTVEGMAGNAMLFWDTNVRFKATGRISNIHSGSDSFHISNGAADIDFLGATLITESSGDDCFAVVSYEGGPIVDGVKWGTLVGRNQRWGRGFTVVGGTNVTVESVDLDGTAGAGIYIACEPEFKTHGVTNVLVKQAKVRRPNTANIHDANVLIYSNRPGYTIRDATITVDPDPAYATWRKPGIGSVSNVRVNGQTIS